jgi:hypothetical protein
VSAWAIASIPFWIAGGIFMLAAGVAIPLRRPDETSDELAMQVLVALAVAGITLSIAAKMVS